MTELGTSQEAPTESTGPEAQAAASVLYQMVVGVASNGMVFGKVSTPRASASFIGQSITETLECCQGWARSYQEGIDQQVQEILQHAGAGGTTVEATEELRRRLDLAEARATALESENDQLRVALGARMKGKGAHG